MKKFFEKYDLIKISGIVILLSVLLTWIIPQGYFQGEMVSEGVVRVGFADFFNYCLMGVYYFYPLVTSLFVLGGFYGVLSKRPGYQRLVKNISEKLKGREVPVVLVVSLVFAILGSLSMEYFPLLSFIPFVITVLCLMKVDKISAFVATFGGLLIGTLGSTYADKVAVVLNSAFTVEVADVLTTQTIIFVISYIALAIFTVLRLKKNKDNKKFESYDKFELVESKDDSKKAPKTWPYIIGIILFVLTIVLAYLPWDAWNVTLFTDITTKINEFAIGDHTILAYIGGTLLAFGAWEIGTFQYVMLFAIVLMLIFGNLKVDEMIKSFGEGMKKISKEVIILLLVYLILEFVVMYPILPVIVDWIANFGDGFNAFLAFICALITSGFGVEMNYVMQLAGSYFASLTTDGGNILVIIFQLAFGIMGFIAPASAILMLGLSYLDIKFKDWFKFIWKFVLAMLVLAIIIIVVIA